MNLQTELKIVNYLELVFLPFGTDFAAFSSHCLPNQRANGILVHNKWNVVLSYQRAASYRMLYGRI